jgi:hypothetical protein
MRDFEILVWFFVSVETQDKYSGKHMNNKLGAIFSQIFPILGHNL